MESQQTCLLMCYIYIYISVFKIKTLLDKYIGRYKACLIAKEKLYKINYEEIFAPIHYLINFCKDSFNCCNYKTLMLGFNQMLKIFFFFNRNFLELYIQPPPGMFNPKYNLQWLSKGLNKLHNHSYMNLSLLLSNLVFHLVLMIQHFCLALLLLFLF